MQWADQLEVDQINAAGGVLGRQLKVVYEDTKNQPAEASAAAVRLVTRDNVAAIFGEFHSSAALAEIEIAHKNGVPWVGTDVWADKITAQQYPEVFRLAPSNSLVYVRIAEWMADQGFKHVAIIAENTDFGQDGAKVVSAELKNKGLDPKLVTIDVNQQDFTPALLRLTSAGEKPDIIEMVVAGQAQYQIVKQACQLGLAPNGKTKLLGAERHAAEESLAGRRRLRQPSARRQRRDAEEGLERQGQGIRRRLPEEIQPSADGRCDGSL